MQLSQYVDETMRVIRSEAVLANAHICVTKDGAALARGLCRRHCVEPLTPRGIDNIRMGY